MSPEFHMIFFDFGGIFSMTKVRNLPRPRLKVGGAMQVPYRGDPSGIASGVGVADGERMYQLSFRYVLNSHLIC
jgi:hypothetical protein